MFHFDNSMSVRDTSQPCTDTLFKLMTRGFCLLVVLLALVFVIGGVGVTALVMNASQPPPNITVIETSKRVTDVAVTGEDDGVVKVTVPYTQPECGLSAIVQVSTTTGMTIGMYIEIGNGGGGGRYQIDSIVSDTSLSILNTCTGKNASPPGSTVTDSVVTRW